MKQNAEYYSNTLFDKDFKNLTAYERFYWNIHYAIVSDINGDGFTDIEGANNFYIASSSNYNYLNGVPEIENFNTPQTTNNLIGERVEVVFRNNENNCYDTLELNFMTRTDVAELIAERLNEYPLSFNKSFLFQHCITNDFRYALNRSENNELWINITESGNDDFLREMLIPMKDLVDAVNSHYLMNAWGYDDIEEILGYKHILETHINHLVNGEEKRENIWLLVNESGLI
jgi:hypothetical protein